MTISRILLPVVDPGSATVPLPAIVVEYGCNRASMSHQRPAAFAFSQPSPPFTCRQPRLLGCAEAAAGDGGRTIENQFRQEAALALTILPYIAAALGVAVFALTTSAPAMVRVEKRAPANPRR